MWASLTLNLQRAAPNRSVFPSAGVWSKEQCADQSTFWIPT
ncbi:unnamed protein product [Brassica oleracea var. botrytis]